MQIHINPDDNPKKATLMSREAEEIRKRSVNMESTSSSSLGATPKRNRARKGGGGGNRRPHNGIFLNFLAKLIQVVFIIGIWGGIGLTLIFLWFSKDLPNLTALSTNTRKPSVTIQTQDGTILGTFGDVYEDMLLVSELPVYVPQALMAVEDRRFESHFGVDIIGLVRAFYANWQAQRVVQGGSTLTQQLAKNFLQTHGLFSIEDRSMKRKIQEVMIALWLEWKFTKPQIMTMYLNRVCFGGTVYGVDAAARVYFNKSARNLTVFEAALIAGLLKAPSRYSPASNPKKSIERATGVLKQMQDLGFIKDYQEYVKQGEIDLANIQINQGKGGKYFADWVYETLPSYIGPITQDLIVITTLDTTLQRHAELVTKHYNETMGKELKASQIAFVAMTPEGAIKAMIGGRSYTESQYNRATQAMRQPGSAFKTFVYLAAMEAGMTPETLIDDSPISIDKWNPKNYKYVSQGEIPLELAFQKSVNTVSIRLTEQLGIDKVADTAERLGLSKCPRIGLSMALGTTETTLLELTAAHATFANKGYRAVPYGVSEIRDKEGNILYQQPEAESTKIIAESALVKMRKLLRAVIAGGSGRAANLDETVRGKTGSNGDLDAWFIFFREIPQEKSRGFTNLVGGIWIGNDDNSFMAKKSTGGNMPTRVARAILEGPNEALRDLNPLNIQEMFESKEQSLPLSASLSPSTFAKKGDVISPKAQEDESLSAHQSAMTNADTLELQKKEKVIDDILAREDTTEESFSSVSSLPDKEIVKASLKDDKKTKKQSTKVADSQSHKSPLKKDQDMLRKKTPLKKNQSPAPQQTLDDMLDTLM